MPMPQDVIQVKYGPEFRRCLVDLDIEGMRRLWKHCAPHLYQMNEAGTLTAMHLARTNMETLPYKDKVYSQNWLNERGIGSFMEDDLRQKGGFIVKATN